MESGVNAGSRVGFKGVEDLGNGLKVGFKLENGFNADDGSLGNDNRLFGREASLHLYSDFGTVSFGRMGGLASSTGTYDVVYAAGDAFDGGDNGVLGFNQSSRLDNVLAYQSPEFAGLQLTAMYSFKNDNTSNVGVEGKSTANRYAALAATGTYGPFQGVAAWERQLYGNVDAQKNWEDGDVFYLGGNFDAGFAKFFALGQYFENVRSISANGFKDAVTLGNKGLKGYGVHVGAQVPVLSGTFTTGLYAMEAEAVAAARNGKDVNGDYVGFAAKYEYPLSQRTSLYTGAGYGRTSFDKHNGSKKDFEDRLVQAYVGVTHAF